jgi:hypothetical protein
LATIRRCSGNGGTGISIKHVDLAAAKVLQDAREVNTKFSKTFTTWFFPVGDDFRAILFKVSGAAGGGAEEGALAAVADAGCLYIGVEIGFQSVMRRHLMPLTCLGPRTAWAGLVATTWPVTSQSNSMRMAARCCLTVGFSKSLPSASICCDGVATGAGYRPLAVRGCDCGSIGTAKRRCGFGGSITLTRNPEASNRLAAEANNARKLIDHLDQSVLAKAFDGQLVPQDPRDEPASALLERIRAERGKGSDTPSKRTRS